MGVERTVDRGTSGAILHLLADLRIILQRHMNTHMSLVILVLVYLDGCLCEEILIFSDWIFRRDIIRLRHNLVRVRYTD